VCDKCTRECEQANGADGELKLCSYGLNYVRLDDDLLIAGITVRDFPETTPARKKRLTEAKRSTVDRAEVERVLAQGKLATERLEERHRQIQDCLVAEFRESKTYQQEIVDHLRPDLERTFAQVHDYKQFVQTIVQNISVVLESRHPDVPLKEKLDKASKQETAVYWAAMLMNEKLDAAMFLDSPERIAEPREQGTFRLHGLVLKYIRIYQSRASDHGIVVAVRGDSWANITGNARALGIIPHTLIDNAIKYAPDRTSITVRFVETSKKVRLEIEGFGPKIEHDEMHRIFDLFYRGRAALERTKEGTGFGLASAQSIARAHGTEIIVEQDEVASFERNHRTTFSVEFPRA
jgi:signal transduction histidine kinase